MEPFGKIVIYFPTRVVLAEVPFLLPEVPWAREARAGEDVDH